MGAVGPLAPEMVPVPVKVNALAPMSKNRLLVAFVMNARAPRTCNAAFKVTVTADAGPDISMFVMAPAPEPEMVRDAAVVRFNFPAPIWVPDSVRLPRTSNVLPSSEKTPLVRLN